MTRPGRHPLHTRILELLDGWTGTTTQITTALGVAYPTAQKHLRQLEADGHLTATKIPTRGRHATAYTKTERPPHREHAPASAPPYPHDGTRAAFLAQLRAVIRLDPTLGEFIHAEAAGQPIPVADPTLVTPGRSGYTRTRHAQRLPDHP